MAQLIGYQGRRAPLGSQGPEENQSPEYRALMLLGEQLEQMLQTTEPVRGYSSVAPAATED